MNAPHVPSAGAPLAGRLILDCSALLPGPFVGKLLAKKGAKVVKIENPERPDGAKRMGRGFYEDLNSLKEVIELDLASECGRKRFHSLVEKADGLIEGFRPETKRKLGLDEKTLRSANPNLCIVSLVGYPEDGPWRDRAGHNLNFEAVTGCLSLFAEMPALPLADLFSAYEGAFAMAAALDSVARGGPPARIVVSMSESLKEIQSLPVAEYRATGVLPGPGQTLFSGLFPCYRLYRAADGKRVSVGALEPKFWRKFCEIVGLADLEADAYATGEKGREVAAKVQGALGSRTWAEWAPLFGAADCCVEPELDYSEVYGDGL